MYYNCCFYRTPKAYIADMSKLVSLLVYYDFSSGLDNPWFSLGSKTTKPTEKNLFHGWIDYHDTPK